MRTIFKVIFISGFLLTNCGDDEEQPVSEQERVKTFMIAHTWKIEHVTVDGVNQSDLFRNFTLQFSNTSFTSNNGEPVWPDSGTWTFFDETGHSLIRNDGIEVEIEGISETELRLSLTWSETTLGSGRSKSISGVHSFLLIK